MSTPDRIYLQIDNGEDQPVTWSEDLIYDSDIMYVKAKNQKPKKAEHNIEYKQLCRDCISERYCDHKEKGPCSNWMHFASKA